MYQSLEASSGATVLVIDDMPENLRLIRSILKKHGYDVRIATDGAMGLQSAQTDPPDVILLDIAMPDMDGYEVCARLKQNNRTSDIPVIFISALDDVSDIVRAFQAGGVDYIARPFHMEEVLVRVAHQSAMRQTTLALNRRIAMEELVTTIATRFTGIESASIDDEIVRALQAIGEFAQVEHCYIALFSSDHTTISHSYEWKTSDGYGYDLASSLNGLSLDIYSWAMKQLRHNQTINVPDVALLPPEARVEQAYWQQRGIRAVFAIPLFQGEHLQGFFGFNSPAPREQWDENDVRLLQVIGTMIVNVLWRKQVEESLHQGERMQALQLDVTRTLIDAHTTDEVIPRLLKMLCIQLDWQFGEMWQVDPTTSTLSCTHVWSVSELSRSTFAQMTPTHTFREGEGLLGQVWETRQPVWVEQLPDSHHFVRVAEVAQAGLQGAFACPVESNAGLEGVMCFYSYQSRPLDEPRSHLMADIGRQFGQFLQRKRAEQAFETEHARLEWVLEHTEVGFLLINTQGTLVYANNQARHVLAIAPDTDIPQHHQLSFLSLIHQHYRCYPQEAWTSWMQDVRSPTTSTDGDDRDNGGDGHDGQHPPPRYLVRPETPSSSAVWLQVDVLELPEKSLSGYLVCLRDVTETMTTQRQMWTFHALISHKLNTPMSCLINSLYLLRESTEEQNQDEVREFAGIAMESAKLLHSQLASIRHFLTTPSRALPGEMCPVQHIPALVKQVCTDVKIDTLVLKDVGHFDTMGQDLYLVISEQAVKLLLRQVLENARKFHPEHAPLVTVELVQPSPVEIAIRVSDNGVHLSPEQLSQVWLPYYQIERGFSGQVPGMGLGLAIVAALLWNVGGSYHIANREDGPGVVVELVMPLAPDEL